MVRTPEQLLKLVRQVALNRKLPPPPYGYIEASRPPTDVNALHVYTQEEREKDAAEIAKRIDEQDAALIREFVEALKGGAQVGPGGKRVAVQDLSQAEQPPGDAL